MGRRRNESEAQELKECEVCGIIIPKVRLKSWSSYNKLHCCSFECKITRMRRVYGKQENTYKPLEQALNAWTRNHLQSA